MRSWQLRSAVRRLPCHANWLGPYSQWRIAKLTMPGEASQQTMRLRQRRWTGCLTRLCHCKRLCFFAWAPTVTCQRQRSQHCSSLTLGRWPRHLLGRWPTMRAPRTARRTKPGARPRFDGDVDGPAAGTRHATTQPPRQAKTARAVCLSAQRTPRHRTPVRAPWQAFPRQPGSRLMQ